MDPGLITAMRRAVCDVDRWSGQELRLFHHNDADGLSSGAILSRAFTRRGFTVDSCCLEKPYPAVLERLLQDRQQQLLVFADFAGRIAPLICNLNRGRNLVLILDHHKAEPSTDPLVHNLDPELHGLRGDRDISASTTCYLFARTLDPVNRDLAPIAVVGAVGDRFFVDGRLAGPNRGVAEEARRLGLLQIEPRAAGERYTVTTKTGPADCAVLAEELDLLGAAGYAQGGPAVGLQTCLDGHTAESDQLVVRLREVRDQAFAEEIRRIEGGALRRGRRLQWLHVGERFAPMGVKMIGAFLDTLKSSDLIDPRLYLAGFQLVPDEIPGLGPIRLGQVKISMRVADRLGDRIRAGTAPGLDTFLPEATGRLGGFSDACHSLTAATTVATGREEELITEMETILERDAGERLTGGA